MRVRAVAAKVLLVALFSSVVLLVAASHAHATEPAYTLSTFPCGAWGGGQHDGDGTTYVACGATIRRYDAAGNELPAIAAPAYTWDVAPSPDAAYLYAFMTVTAGSNGQQVRSEVRRFNRQGDGSYVVDGTWRLASFPYGATEQVPLGRYLHTDAWGNIYVSNGSWHHTYGAPNMVLVYNPDGSLRTSFGEWGNDPGLFNVNMGIATTRDGHMLYTIEHTNGRVQKFRFQDGRYEFVQSWGQTDINCAGTGVFAAPYDIGVDPWGYVYVLDTSCNRLQKFTSTGSFLMVTNVSDGQAGKAHGIAVDGHGNAYVGQYSRKASRTTPEPGPWPALVPLPAPDNTAPVIESVAVPDPTASRTVRITLDATDNGELAEVRVANEDGIWSAWRPYSSSLLHTLSEGFTYKSVTVQVRDGAGNESAAEVATTRLVPDTVRPVLSRVSIPTRTRSRTITVRVLATDNVRPMTMRVRNGGGSWSSWRMYRTRFGHRLRPGYGRRVVYVQVRDAAGNASLVRADVTRRLR